MLYKVVEKQNGDIIVERLKNYIAVFEQPLLLGRGFLIEGHINDELTSQYCRVWNYPYHILVEGILYNWLTYQQGKIAVRNRLYFDNNQNDANTEIIQWFKNHNLFLEEFEGKLSLKRYMEYSAEEGKANLFIQSEIDGQLSRSLPEYLRKITPVLALHNHEELKEAVTRVQIEDRVKQKKLAIPSYYSKQ